MDGSLKSPMDFSVTFRDGVRDANAMHLAGATKDDIWPSGVLLWSPSLIRPFCVGLSRRAEPMKHALRRTHDRQLEFG